MIDFKVIPLSFGTANIIDIFRRKRCSEFILIEQLVIAEMQSLMATIGMPLIMASLQSIIQIRVSLIVILQFICNSCLYKIH